MFVCYHVQLTCGPMNKKTTTTTTTTTFHRLFMKLFRTNSIELVKDYQCYF